MLTSSKTVLAIKGDGSPSELGVVIFVALVVIAAVVIVVQKSRHK